MNRAGGLVTWGAAFALFGAWQYYDYSTHAGDNFSEKQQERWNEQRKMITKAKDMVGMGDSPAAPEAPGDNKRS